MALWFDKLYSAWKAGSVEQAVFLGFQLSVLRICPQIIEETLPMVFPRNRLAFWTSPEALYNAITPPKNEKDKDAYFRKVQAIDSHVGRCTEAGRCVDTPQGFLCPSMAPPHDQVIIYMPPANVDTHLSLCRFYQAFSPIAAVPPIYKKISCHC